MCLPSKFSWIDALHAWYKTLPDLPCPSPHMTRSFNVIPNEAVTQPPVGGVTIPLEEDTLGLPNFRVSCERLGHHAFRSTVAASEFGGALHNLFGLRTHLKRPDLEVHLEPILNPSAWAVVGHPVKKCCFGCLCVVLTCTAWLLVWSSSFLLPNHCLPLANEKAPSWC